MWTWISPRMVPGFVLETTGLILYLYEEWTLFFKMLFLKMFLKWREKVALGLAAEMYLLWPHALLSERIKCVIFLEMNLSIYLVLVPEPKPVSFI